MRRVLLITTAFPPVGGGAVMRALKWAKYLPASGWKVTVITPDHVSPKFHDPGLEKQIDPQHVEVVRVPFIDCEEVCLGLEKRLPSLGKLPGLRLNGSPSDFVRPHQSALYAKLNRWVVWPDAYRTWIRPAIRQGLRICAIKKMDVIVSQSPSAAAHLTAMGLKILGGNPWVADFKDPWTKNPFTSYASRLHLKLNQILEQRVLARVDGLVTVSDSIREELVSNNSLLDGKAIVIPNGYDPDDLPSPEPQPTGPLTLVHAGALYGQRKLDQLLEAMSFLLNYQLIKPHELRVVHYGQGGGSALQKTRRLGLDGMFVAPGHLDHAAVLGEMARAHALLLIPGPGKGTVTGKIYEYLGLERPILVVGDPDGQAAKLATRAGLGILADERDVFDIARQLIGLLGQYRNTGCLSAGPDRDFIQQFQRRKQAAALAEFLGQIIEPNDSRAGA